MVPYLLYTWGLKSVENGKAAIIASIEPVTAALLGILFYHESVTAVSFIGFVMVLAALFALQLCGNIRVKEMQIRRK